MRHQEVLTDRFLAQGWKSATHPRYTVPVPVDRFMRCWGSSQPSRTGGLDFERSDCVMDTRIFVGDFISTGMLSVRHESYDGSKLGTLRFAAQYSASFRNENFRRSRTVQTQPQCQEDFVDRGGLTLRAVVCLRAYRKMPQLYDVSVLVATLDQSAAGVQGRFDVYGVSYPNAMKLAQHYIEAYGWVH
jgi:hypothetical protein